MEYGRIKMSRTIDKLYPDVDWLVGGFLIANWIWVPGDDERHNAEPVHPELLRHLVSEAFERGDFTLRYWRNEFYKWQAGRYFKVSDAEMKCWVKRHLHEHNQHARTFSSYSDQYVHISSQLVTNILLCLVGTEGVHIPETRALNSWDDGREQLGIQTFVFNNGLLMTDDRDDRPVFTMHTPHYFTLIKLPYDYQPQAECPRWRDFLANVMDNDTERIELLTQWASMSLS